MRVADAVAVVCFCSLALLGWWVLVNGFSWAAVVVGLWWLGMGVMAAIRPEEWKKRDGGRGNG